MSEHREGTLFYDTEAGHVCGRIMVKDVWVPVRIEMGDDWYLVGLNVSRLDGLRVRM